MMKRPLAVCSVVVIMILFLLKGIGNMILIPNPVKITAEGEKELCGYLQGNSIRLYGVVSDYSYCDDYGYITTECILKDVHILIPDEKKPDNLSINNPQTNETETYKKITTSGQSVIVYFNQEVVTEIGNTALISGKLSFFEPATNPGQFDAEKYYGNKDVLFSVKKATLLKKTEDKAHVRQWLKDLGEKQQHRLGEYLSEANATIMKAMLFGNKEELDEEIKELYQDNGIAHLLAISGLHISLLGLAVYHLLQRLPLPGWGTLVLSELFLVAYGIMVGFSASAFRAIGMFTFMLISKITKRSYDMLTALAFTATIQLLIHPGYLFDCSFQLSYGAILGIGVLLPALERINKSVSIVWISKINSLFLPSLSVSLITFPILIWHFHELSLFSVILNIIVIPFMSILLLCTIAMLAASYIWVPLAKILTLPITLILGIYEYSCRFLEMLPIGQYNVASPSKMVLLVYFCLHFFLTRLVKKKCHPYQFCFLGIALLILFYPQNPQFRLWITDVGQGDSSVIFTKEGKCFVIDCGSTSKYCAGERILIPFLKYYGINRVDAVFVTHADQDHMNGVVELLLLGEEENIKTDRILVYEKALETEPEEWIELTEAARKNGTEIVGMKQGDVVATDSVRMECLYPLREQSGLTGNASSLVLSLEVDVDNFSFFGMEAGDGFFDKEEQKDDVGKKDDAGTFKALFTGDLEITGEVLFCEEYKGRIGEYDVLKVGHHGSSGSSGTEFLEWVSPKCAVISCGKDNPYGHPHAETLERLEASGSVVITTSKHGAVCVEEASDERYSISY